MTPTEPYVPRPGSVADRAILWLTVNGKTEHGDLADAIDCDAGSIYGCLSTAEKHGVLARDRYNGKVRWFMVDRAAAEPAEPTEPAAEPDPAIEVTATNAVGLSVHGTDALHIPKFGEVPRREHAQPAETEFNGRLPLDRDPLSQLHAITQPTSSARPAADVPTFACALFNDGRLLIEIGGETVLRLTAAQAEVLDAYLHNAKP